jgi:two-component system chemotaxis response regulator CheY
MAGLLGGDSKINLTTASVMLIDPRPLGMNVLLQIFRGFGVSAPLMHANAEDALTALKGAAVDLVVVEANMPGIDGYAFTKALRHSNFEPNRHAAVIIVAGHTPKSKIAQIDCGANFVIAKALTPKKILDHITLIAEFNRPFIEVDGYIGPERRFQRLRPPARIGGRRKDDLFEGPGEATTPNLTRADFDNRVRPPGTRR